MEVSALVRREVRRRFAPHEAVEVERLLELTALPFLDAPDRRRDRDRVHLALLKQANGSLPAFTEHLAVAATDWRDLLVGAGLGHENWPEVLRDAGFPVP